MPSKRETKYRQATQEISSTILEIAERHKLTFCELAAILSEELNSYLRGFIRVKRRFKN